MDQRYFLPPLEILNILQEKNVKYLFHANTLTTSITFINQGAILSRSFVEQNGLIQTGQKSDYKDKKYNVWDDVFLDALDLHKQYSTANKYGPILFIIDLDFLKSPELQGVLVTKTNPFYWNVENNWENKYYDSVEEIKKDYLTGQRLDSQIMFTFRSINNLLSMHPFVLTIGIDRPNILVTKKDGTSVNVGDHAYEKINYALAQKGLNIPTKFRHVNATSYCGCFVEYKRLYDNEYSEFKKRFALPQSML